MLTGHQLDLFKLLASVSGFTTIEELSIKLQRSQRSIRYDLDAIESLGFRYAYRLQRVPSMGIRLHTDSSTRIKDLFESELMEDKSFRTDAILFELLIKNHLSIGSMMDVLHVSRSSVSRLVSQSEQLLSTFSCAITRSRFGVVLESDENSIVRMSDELIQKPETARRFIELAKKENIELFQEVELWIEELGCEHEFTLETVSYQTILAFVLVHAFRCHYVFSNVCEENMGIPYVSNWKISVEAKRGCLRLLPGCRVISGQLPQLVMDDVLAFDLFDQLNQACNHQLSEDPRSHQALLLHLRATVHRVRHEQLIENPLKEDVFVSYAILSEVVKEVIRKFEKEHDLEFNDDEIAFVVMHVQAMMQRKAQAISAMRVAVVCHYGLATSSLLQSRLQSLFPSIPFYGPYSLVEFEKIGTEEMFDYVVSTVDLKLKNQLLVLPMLSSHDIEMIERKISNHAYLKQCEQLIKGYTYIHDQKVTMASLIKKEHIHFAKHVVDYREAVTLAANPLLKDGVIEPRYVQKMIWAISNLGPYMVILPKVAFVHAGTEDGVNRNGISCLHLSSSVLFGEKRVSEVSVIFVIASVYKEDAGLLKLVSILESEDNLNRLLQANDVNDILGLIKEG